MFGNSTHILSGCFMRPASRGAATAIPFGYDKPRPANVLSTIGLQSLTASICIRNFSVRTVASSLQRPLSRRFLHNMLSLSG